MPKIKKPGEPKLDPKLSEKFHAFILHHPPRQVSRHLRCILLDYIGAQIHSGFPVDFDEWLWELSDPFDLLESAAE